MSLDSNDLYKQAGVDVSKGDELVNWLGKENPDRELKDFSASYEPNFSGYKKPLLVSSTDGVGTKLLLALEQDKLESLGYDLVAMCINDLYTSGAKPLFFLDYYATSNLDSSQFKRVLTSIKNALAEAECSLLGGETAELPGLYHHNHFDLAGFVVGVVDKEKRMSPSATREGDALYALPSNGFHSNGYSLLRKFLKEKPKLVNNELITRLLLPTRIYWEVPKVFAELGPEVCHAASHITGGGISGNLKRILPEGLAAQISFDALRTPEWMKSFLDNFTSDLKSFESVFNMGCGMILSVSKEDQELFKAKANALNLDSHYIGQVVSKASSEEESVVYL